jgi:glycerol-3-phosphate acyltransferase PlsX
MRLGVDLGGADSSAFEFLSVLSQECASLPLNLYIPYSQLPLPCALSPCHNIFLASEEIGMDEAPVQAIRTKKKSSLMMGLADLKEGSIQAFLSLANTGALVVASSLVLGRMQGIHGPALVAHFPSPIKEVAVLDLGAYPKHTSERYQELVTLGQAYAKICFKIQSPSIGLLNIGHESMKGTDALRQADSALKEQKTDAYTYVGFIEPVDIFQGRVDVAVTDGFTGNVLLKTAEGAQEFLNRFHTCQKKFPQQAGLLIGVCGDVYKCHGRTSPHNLAQVVLSLSDSLATKKGLFYSLFSQ